MEPNNQIIEKNTEGKSWAVLLVILGAFLLCILTSSALLCGLGYLYAHKGGSPLLLPATPLPTVDLVKELSSDPAWDVLIDDEFSDNSNKWNVSKYKNDNIELDRKITDGKYIWEFQAKNGWNFWGWPDIRNVADFAASIDVELTQGSDFDSYGLIMRAAGENYYLFEVNQQGKFVFASHYQDKFIPVLEGQRNGIIKPGEPNRVAVKAVKSHFTFYINNQQVGEADDSTLLSGHVGILLAPSGLPGSPREDTQGASLSLQTGNPSRFVVENFKVWVPGTSQAPNESGEFLPLEPHQGRIVYVSDQDGNREIYSIDSDGKDPDRITNDPADDYSPKWSPDGSQIVFVSTREGDPEIFVMDRDGSNMKRMTYEPGDDLDPSWSPDGQKIVFSSNRSGNYNLYILDVNTLSVDRLTEASFDDRYPDWSPRDDLILFQSNRKSSSDLFTVSIKTLMVTQITRHNATYSSYPGWSPNGLSYVHETVLYDGRTGIATRDFPNGNYQTVVELLNSNIQPAWSPDGVQIIFISDRDGQTDIYIVSRDGKAIFRLTNTPAVESQVDWTAG